MQDENVLVKILVDASTEVPVGQPIALAVEDEDAYQAYLKFGSTEVSTPAAAPPVAAISTPAASTSVQSSSTSSKSAEVKLSPAARYIANNYKIDVSAIKGSGKHGMIVKGDLTSVVKSHPQPNHRPAATTSTSVVSPDPVIAAKSSAAVQTTTAAPVNDRYVDIPNTNMRKIIAKRLSESKSNVPHFYTTIECNVDSIMKLRKTLKRDYNANISVNDFVIKAAALALRDIPAANGKWDAKSNAVVPGDDIDISVAVATPNGLITPIVTNPHRRGLVDINLKVKDLATRARDNKLKPEEFQGGSFSISNLGIHVLPFFVVLDLLIYRCCFNV